jgi:hypothetical protein
MNIFCFFLVCLFHRKTRKVQFPILLSYPIHSLQSYYGNMKKLYLDQKDFLELVQKYYSHINQELDEGDGRRGRGGRNMMRLGRIIRLKSGEVGYLLGETIHDLKENMIAFGK